MGFLLAKNACEKRILRDNSTLICAHLTLILTLDHANFSSFSLPERVPKGPFRTKTTTTIAKIVNYYAVVFLLRPPDLLRRGPFSERENVCNSQENGVRTRCAAIVNHRAILKILRVVIVFLVRRGPLGTSEVPKRDGFWGRKLPKEGCGGQEKTAHSGRGTAHETWCLLVFSWLIAGWFLVITAMRSHCSGTFQKRVF